ncbi:MAG: hypothetical protein ABI665_03840 [Vicinamibacterales bacterium]
MLEIAVCDYLLSNGAVAAIAAARGYVQKFPQSAEFPAFRVQLIDDIEQAHLRGGSATRPARVQVDAVGEESSGVDAYGQAVALAGAIEGAMMNKAPFKVTVSDGGSPAVQTVLELKVVRSEATPPIYDQAELNQFKVGRDYIVWARVVS